MKPRTVRLLTPPAVEPVSLSEAKAHLRIMDEQEDDDALIAGLIATARRLIERRLGISLIATQYRAKWPAGTMFLELPNPPVLVAQAYPIAVSIDGAALAAGDYELDQDATPAELELDERPTGEVSVTYWSGVAPGGLIAPQLRSALLLIVGHLYAHREAATTEAVGELPMGVEVLLASESVNGSW